MCLVYVPVFVFLRTPTPHVYYFWSRRLLHYHNTRARTGTSLPSNVCVCYNSYKQHFRSRNRNWRISRKHISISLLLLHLLSISEWWAIYQDDADPLITVLQSRAIIHITGKCQSIQMMNTFYFHIVLITFALVQMLPIIFNYF